MLGVGLDSDGHKRVTTGENFALVGGSKETHEAMTEKAVKINEKLAKKGKRLEDVSRAEFDDIDGNPFRLSSLRGEKVLLVAWAPY